jgi:hypothetical protein
MPTGVINSTGGMLAEHLPYRLTHLDGLVWACEFLLERPRPGSIALRLDGQADAFMVTNPLVEVGVLNCRLVLEFLGIRLDRSNRLTDIPLRHADGDDWGIELLGLPKVSVPRFLACGASEEGVGASATRILIAARKGVAHFTQNPQGRALVPDALVCAEAVMACADRYVYGAPANPVPRYRRWTARQ